MAVNESAMNKWVCAVMRILFTRQELIEGYVCDEDSTSKFKRLDPERIDFLEKALYAKYPAGSTNGIKVQDRSKNWKHMKKVDGRVCYDARKKVENAAIAAKVAEALKAVEAAKNKD